MANDINANRKSTIGGNAADLYNRVNRRLRDSETRSVTILLLLACIGLLIVGVLWIIILRDLPSSVELDRSQFAESSIVLSADGKELTRYADRNRTWVPLDSISSHVTDALIAVEDHRFYSHSGIDYRRLIGAVFKTVSGDVQGGSTLTMQFARNAFPELADDGRIARKVKEWILSLKLESRHSKDDILEMYLNTVPFMYNAFGIEAAARTYFQKPAIDLEVDEAATLVGMLKGTVYYNPVRNPKRSHERRNVVLRQMVHHGYLEQAAYDDIRDEETELNFRRLRRGDDVAPYFAEYLRLWLDEWAEENSYNLYTDGLRIHTTLDSELQAAAEEAVLRIGADLQAVADVEWSSSSIPHRSTVASSFRNFAEGVDAFAYFWEAHPQLSDYLLRRSSQYRQLTAAGLDETAALDSLRNDHAYVDSVRTVYQTLQASLVAIDPRTGEVKAWVGGRDFNRSQFDNVAQARRQPGSTFKPFVFGAALDRGYRSTHLVRDETFEFVDPQTGRRWAPRNVGGISGRTMTLEDALALSKNTVAARLTVEVGPGRVAEFARRAGITSDMDVVPSLGLGTSEVSLLELTAGYATIAAMGRYHEPVFVSHIEDVNGRVVARFERTSRQAMSPSTAYELVDMMRSVLDYGTGIRMRTAYGASGEFAAKTGTSQEGADGWFMFMHPNLVVGAWVGFPTSAITFRRDYWGQGARTALPIVGAFYRNARSSSANPYRSGSWDPPAGYIHPERQDSLLFAGGDWHFNYLLDSLRRGSEDLFESVSEEEEIPLEELSTADSLNRMQRIDANRETITRQAEAPNSEVEADTTSEDAAPRRRGW